MSLLICCFLALCVIQKTTFSIIDQTNDLSRDLMMTVFDLLLVFWPSIKYGEVQWTMDRVQTDIFTNRTMPHQMLICAKAFLNYMYDTLFDMLKHVFYINLRLLLVTKKKMFLAKMIERVMGIGKKVCLFFLDKCVKLWRNCTHLKCIFETWLSFLSLSLSFFLTLKSWWQVIKRITSRYLWLYFVNICWKMEEDDKCVCIIQ